MVEEHMAVCARSRADGAGGRGLGGERTPMGGKLVHAKVLFLVAWAVRAECLETTDMGSVAANGSKLEMSVATGPPIKSSLKVVRAGGRALG